MKRIAVILSVVLIMHVMCTDVWAQATAQINGTVKDQSGAVLPGVEIAVTQVDTGIVRDTITNETGSYILPNLPIGPYRLEAALPGFRTYAQTGIVLQVNSSPVIPIVLEVGQVTEQIEVQANAALVETRNVGVGTVVENARILELPLNGRAMIELVALSGGATPAPKVDGSGGRDPFSRGNVSVAGGMNTGLNYTLDGAFHNNPHSNSYMSMPFPDALQEFKVETGATGAQNGVKSSGSVSLVTKSGSNEFHGNVFEFVRNGKFNARNAFATRRDSLKRNQFGGTLGGPIQENKLFFFAAYQRTTLREDPSDILQFVPTQDMLAGDFTAFASPACNAGRQITLRAPFVNSRIDPALFSKPAVALTKVLPKPLDSCGRVIFGMPRPQNDNMVVGRIDYQRSSNHSIFGRYLLDTTHTTPPYEVTKTVLAVSGLGTGNRGRAHAVTLGDTYLFGNNVVNAIRLTTNRVNGEKFAPNVEAAGYGPADIGIKTFAALPHELILSVTGGFNVFCGGCGTGVTITNIFSGNDDLSVVRGNHQLALGAQMTGWWNTSTSVNAVRPSFTFNGQTTGLGMTDFFMGNVSNFELGNPVDQHKAAQYFGFYGADVWKVNQKLTLNYGLRWEPYFPMRNLDGSATHFDIDSLRNGIKTTKFTNVPPGIFFPGDPGFQGGKAAMNKKWWNFSPRVGLAWDLSGDGRTSVRASAGTFYDFPSTSSMYGLSYGAPFSARFLRTNVSFADPWANEPGGDPFPNPYGPSVPRDVAWPLYSVVSSLDYDAPNMQVYQWNLSVQKQIGSDLLVSANYLGNATRHMWTQQHINPAVFLGLGPCTLNGVSYSTCSTTANTDQRRRLSLEIPEVGQYVGVVNHVDTGATANYNGMVLSVERRAASGVTVIANYTWSHCISDPGGNAMVVFSGGYSHSDNRGFDRGNCTIAGTDRRHVLNSSAVAETPRFSNATLRVVGSGWRFSPIFRILAGDYLDITTNQDRALSGTPGQRVDQILVNPYGDKSVGNYLNPAAFRLSALGTLGSIGKASIRGPGTWQFDVAVSRTFQLRETQKLEFRVEAFNVPNSFRMNSPVTNFNSNTFGQVTSAQDPRIMQFALKYVF